MLESIYYFIGLITATYYFTMIFASSKDYQNLLLLSITETGKKRKIETLSVNEKYLFFTLALIGIWGLTLLFTQVGLITIFFSIFTYITNKISEKMLKEWREECELINDGREIKLRVDYNFKYLMLLKFYYLIAFLYFVFVIYNQYIFKINFWSYIF